MKFTTTLMAAVFALGSAVTTASAATLVSGNVCEGGVPPVAGVCPADHNLGDFGTNFSKVKLDLIGDTTIWGGVAHRDNSSSRALRFVDNWTMNLGSKVFKATFNWQVKYKNTNPNFDGQIVVGDTLSGNTIVGGDNYEFTTGPEDNAVRTSGSIDLGNLTGDGLLFSVDPIFGQFATTADRRTHEVGTWDLRLTEIAPVPLPASALLLMAGLGGLGAMRRFGRKS